MRSRPIEELKKLNAVTLCSLYGGDRQDIKKIILDKGYLNASQFSDAESKNIKIGDPACSALIAFGNPNRTDGRINTTIVSGIVREQWVYKKFSENFPYMYIYITNGHISGIQL